MARGTISRASQSLDKYLQEIGEVPLLVPQEEIELARKIAAEIEASQAESLATSEIRTLAIDRLGEAKPSYKDNWIMYDRQRGRI